MMLELRGAVSWQTGRVRLNLAHLQFNERDYAAERDFIEVLDLTRKLGGDNLAKVRLAESLTPPE
jgi:hypothetical protein